MRSWWGAIVESVCSRSVGSSQCGAFRRRMVCAVWQESAMCVARYCGREIFVTCMVPDAVPFVCFKASVTLRWCMDLVLLDASYVCKDLRRWVKVKLICSMFCS